jgi:nicotinate-nucleotide adenylyltransferase
MKARIGIYSGTFNPIHTGHIGFALQAVNLGRLDKVYFMPERYRRNKTDVAHFAHRVAMVRQAIRPHQRLGLIEDSSISFSVEHTLPKLSYRFKGATLVFLIGSDTLARLKQWPKVESLLRSSELIVGIREGDKDYVRLWLNQLPVQPQKVQLINSFVPGASSTKVREALRRQQETDGILPSVRKYSDQNWLYISIA